MKDELNFETRKFSECNNEKHLSTDELSTGYTIKEMMNGTFEITGAKYAQNKLNSSPTKTATKAI